MIAFLRGTIISKGEMSVTIDTGGVGYEVSCPPQVVASLAPTGGAGQLFIHTHYKTDGVALFGFSLAQEKSLFLCLIKVDSVGPKSALNILSAAPWDEIIHLIEDGDVSGLSKLPKISKKTAEHLVVKLKGKLGDLLLAQAAPKTARISEHRRMRLEALTALSHLGFKPQDIERTLADLNDDIWHGDLQSVIRFALNDLSGNT
jgi:Holliday junction DNA helicase RuvA